MSLGSTNAVELTPGDPIFLHTGVSQSNFALVVEAMLVVGLQTGVQNPLFKTQVAIRQVFGNCLPVRCTRVSGEMRDAGDDTTPPVLNDFFV
jgi:hypothetical protein